MKEKIQMKGRYTIKYTNIETGEQWQDVYENLITSAMYNAIFKFLDQAISNPDCDAINITHLAIGTGTTPASQADTTLQTEIFRKQVSFKGYNTARFTCETSISASEGNPVGEFIREVGIFCKATDTADSGLLISRALVNIYKTASTAIIVVWELTY